MSKKKLLKEFKKAHSEYSLKNGGYWKNGWRKVLKFADLVDGYWYWMGHRVKDLIK
jgi:hypothetical protein